MVFLSICFLITEPSPIGETGTMIVSGRSDLPNRVEEGRRGRCVGVSLGFLLVV
jgi:hypothetical protein